MSERAIPILIGLAVVAILVGAIFWSSKDAHMEVQGEILKVRTHAAEENSSLAFLDFRFVNTSAYQFVVRDVEVTLEDGAGKTHNGIVIADVDAKRVLNYYKILGGVYNDSLKTRDKFAARESADRMICARFDVPEAVLTSRKGFRVRVREVDGVVSEIPEKKTRKE